ncbi:MAG TPA: ATP-dependent helicase HrpB [Deltaproteobacteria bacterium]|nr:ATP-dependent helicase HrpB [Deltaproteobacteria bacterium]
MDPLPIDRVLPEVIEAAGAGGFVLVAPPGAGKTTRVPPALLPHVPGQIVVLEPRRVAARAAARRMASEAGCRVGSRIGWQIRFERRAGPDTRILVVTEGILLRRLQSDPFLEGVSAVLLDEFHERSLSADLCLALLAEVQREARGDLVIGVMSATLDPQPVAAYLGGVPVVHSEGRTFPIELSWLPRPQGQRLEEAVSVAVRRALDEGQGDVLAFLPGVRGIRRAAAALGDLREEVLELHGGLSSGAQDRALRRADHRRVVLATNLAETSVTVPGVRAVVDTGLVRRPRFDPSTGLDRLETVRISSASADQRAGRAGRTSAGRVYRLWSERIHRTLEPFDPPELLRIDLSGALLQLLAWGADPQRFPWLTPPPDPALQAAGQLLERLGAVRGGRLTQRGRALASLPLHPRLGVLYLEGSELGHPGAAARAAALLSEEGLGRGRHARHSSSDLLDALDALGAHDRIDRIAAGLRRAQPAHAGAGSTLEEALGRAVLAAWPDRVALRRAPDSDRARLVGGRGVRLAPSSSVRSAPLFVAIDVDDRGPEGLVRAASAISEPWLITTTVELTAFDPAVGEVRARRVRSYGDLILESQPISADPLEAALALEQAARQRLDDALPVDGSFDQLRARLAFVHRLDPERWPEPDAGWWAELLPGLCVGARSLAALRRADWAAAVRDALGWPRWQALARLAPERIEVPSGSALKIHYSLDGPPVLAARIQELFGWRTTPTVGDGRVPLLLHLLAPNQRPQQITDDLEGFWARGWPEVRKELRARYPRHAWPEDPLTATAERRPGRRRS